MKTTVDGVSMDDGLFEITRSRSMNNRLIVQVYKKEALKSEIKNGFALIQQKVSLKGLKVLVDCKLSDNTLVRKDSTAYIKEETLHTQAWAQKALECDALKEPFLIVDLSYVEFITPPPEGSLRC